MFISGKLNSLNLETLKKLASLFTHVDNKCFKPSTFDFLKLDTSILCMQKWREREKRKSDSQQKFQFYYVFSFFSVRPLKVEILNSNNPFSADRKYEIPCQTFGSRPPADISWWLDGKQLTSPRYNHTQQVNNKVNNNILLAYSRKSCWIATHM